jgi:hypothetical protein
MARQSWLGKALLGKARNGKAVAPAGKRFPVGVVYLARFAAS